MLFCLQTPSTYPARTHTIPHLEGIVVVVEVLVVWGIVVMVDSGRILVVSLTDVVDEVSAGIVTNNVDVGRPAGGCTQPKVKATTIIESKNLFI